MPDCSMSFRRKTGGMSGTRTAPGQQRPPGTGEEGGGGGGGEREAARGPMAAHTGAMSERTDDKPTEGGVDPEHENAIGNEGQHIPLDAGHHVLQLGRVRLAPVERGSATGRAEGEGRGGRGRNQRRRPGVEGPRVRTMPGREELLGIEEPAWRNVPPLRASSRRSLVAA